MKIRALGISLLIVFGLRGSSAWDWAGVGGRILTNFTIDSLKNEYSWIEAKDPKMYREFRNNYLLLRNQIDEQLEKFDVAGEDKYLKNAAVLLDQLEEEENKLLIKAKKTLSASDYERLKKEIQQQQANVKKEFDLLGTEDSLAALWKKYAVPEIKNELNKDNPYKNDRSIVRQSNNISEYEKLFLTKRLSRSNAGLEKFLAVSADKHKPIALGFAGTGGGYRAMTLTVGYLLAAEENGLLDSMQYISSLSGSTWFLAPWILSGGTVAEYKKKLLDKIRNNDFNIVEKQTLLKKNYDRLANDIIWKKFIFGQTISSIDLYGFLLASVFLSDFGSNDNKQHLSEQYSKIKDGNKPFPLYTAISMHKESEATYRYNWYEINPLEVRNLENNLFIPAYSFGWEFSEGKSLQSAPEQSLGYLMGIFGSAYTVNFKDLWRMAAQGAANSSMDVKKNVVNFILRIIAEEEALGTSRLFPAQVANPFKNLPSSFKAPTWLKKRSYLTFIDAGIDYNIPGRPLWRPERKLNVIFIGESSGNVATGNELTKLFADIKRFYGIEYTRVDNKLNKTLGLYKDFAHDSSPRVIYVNYLKDTNLMQAAGNNPELQKIINDYKLADFDPIQCLEKDFCNTFNFSYSENDFLQLSGMAFFNMKANQPHIVDWLIKEFSIEKKDQAKSDDWDDLLLY